MTAVTDVNITDAAADVIYDAKRGDIVKLLVVDGVIIDAQAVINFNEYDIVGGEDAGCVGVTYTAGVPVNYGVCTDDQEYLFGAVIKGSNNGNRYLRLLDGTGCVVLDYGDPIDVIIKEGDANVYIYDPMLRETRRLYVGSLADAYYDADLLTYNVVIKNNGTTIAAPAYGMMDYIFVRYYGNRPADIVIYKNYEFEYIVE